MRVLTAIYAHPDDETFSAGGSLARYSTEGVKITLLCATDGDAGKTSGLQVSSRSELAAIRRNELQAAAKILGIHRVESLGLPDGSLADVDQDTLISRIVAHIRREKPQVIVTFGPEGAPNTHRDHRAVSRAATAAFFLAANPTMFADQLRDETRAHAAARLYYVAWPPPKPGGDMKAQSVPATARIDVRRFRAQEDAAWRAHLSQHALQRRYEEYAATDEELFALAAGISQPTTIVEDLFAGL